MVSMNMYKALQNTIVEKDVENIYKTSLIKAFGIFDNLIRSKYKTDGVLYAKKYGDVETNLIMLLECKFDLDFSKKSIIIKVLIQALYYLKKFEDYGDDLPNVILIGDKNECLCLHSNDIKNYLNDKLDWTIAPSSAGNKNPHLLKKMISDDNISPYVFNINDDFNFTDVVTKIVELSNEIVNFIKITEKNIDRIFNEFVTNVLFNKTITKELANKLVNIFLAIITNPTENYLHPNKPQTLVTKDFGNIRINRDKFKAFFRHFQREYAPEEKDKLIANCDRLIEDTTRRFQGEFYTPTAWVMEAYKMIEKEFGENWKQEYTVWDPAWGTGNLTRDFNDFKELYVSTLNQSDIGIANQNGYNINATKFQYDFLNDSHEKLPENLRNVLSEKKPILILMNPPYSAPTSHGEKSKKGVSDTQINKFMIKNIMGQSSQQLFAQFIYRFIKLKELYNHDNIKICMFTSPIFLTGIAFEKFRPYFLSNFNYNIGMLFNAREFDGTSKSKEWGVSFTIWNNGETPNKNEFKVTLKATNSNGNIVNIY